MVLPVTIYAVKAVGLAYAVYFTLASRKALSSVTIAEVAGSSTVPARWLLVYRVVAFFYALAIGTRQFLIVGPRLFTFFTIWNWWLLTAYFGLAAVASMRAALRSQQDNQTAQAGLLEKVVVIIYHIESPLVWVIDVTTWFVLVPALMATPDPDKRQYWINVMFCFTSYNQHGFNAMMMLGELMLNGIPAIFSLSGVMALWLMAYSAWSTLFFWKTGRFIYPFLDAHKPYAWAAYLALFGAFLASNFLFVGLDRAKHKLLARRQGVAAAERKAQ